ncbi:MAG: hypothetical protein JWQ09_4350 [Segetibacter sp.]|nr:hypothetical protein [Segetibacter sp.]
MKESAIDWKKWRSLSLAILYTLFWIVLFPILYIGASVYGSITSSHMTPQLLDYLKFFSLLLLPSSSPVTIVCIWLSYYYKKSSLMHYSNFIPLFTLIGIFFVVGLLEIITEAYIRYNLIK